MQRISWSILAVPLALAACAAPPPRAARLVDTGTPALHAIDSSELRQLMLRMNNLMFERNLTDVEMDKQRREAIGRVKAAAEGVDQAVDGIVAALPRLQLDAGEQKTFRALALRLREDARTLNAQADAQRTDDIPATLERMAATCTSCHELFRDFVKKGGRP